MAYDDLLGSQVGIVRGYIGGTLLRWAKAANAARKEGFTIDKFWEVAREQFVHNWDTWSSLIAFPGDPVVPTVAVRGKALSMQGAAGGAFVDARLDRPGTTFEKTALEQFGGTGQIAPGDYTLTVAGTFAGRLDVEIDVPTVTAGTYRGLALIQRPNTAGFEPLAWIVVVAS